METRSIKQLNNLFERGIVPEEFNLSLQSNNKVIDWDKVLYNSFYKRPEFILEHRLKSDAILSFPCGDKIVEKMVENITTPLEEIKERQRVLCECGYDSQDEENL